MTIYCDMAIKSVPGTGTRLEPPNISIPICLQDAMEFAHSHNISAKTVVFEGIDKAPEAYTAMRQGVYRVVIKIADE